MTQTLAIASTLATLAGLAGSVIAIVRWSRGHAIVLSARDRQKPVERRSLTMIEVQRGMEFVVQDARRFKPDFIVGINRGGAIIGGWIAKQLGFGRIVLLTVNYDHAGAQRVVEHNGIADRLHGRVLLVDDAKRKGEHMRAASAYLVESYPGVELRRSVLLEMIMQHQGPETHVLHGAPVECYGYYTNDSKVTLPWDVI